MRVARCLPSGCPMRKSFALAFAFLVLAGCLTPEQRAAREAKREAKRAEKEEARRNRDERDAANQQAQADAAAAAQPVNMETLCQSIANAHAARCNTQSASTYLWCLGTSAPATVSAVSWGETQQCAADIGAADCDVIASGVLPASCAQGQASDVQPVKTDLGGVSVAKACDVMMEQHCSKCGDAASMQACVDESRTWCYNGRDGGQGTGMSKKQQAQCAKAYKGLKCSAAVTGYVPIECPGLRG
jgi:hypothetical protein